MKTIRMLSVLGCLTAAAFGQVSREELANMNMWPGVAVKWLGSTDFSQTNYGYYRDYSPSVPFDGAYTDWSKWRFAIYGGLTGKNVYYWANWSGPIDQNQLANCGHTHVTWSSWFQIGYYSGGVYYSGWSRGAGGGMSGVKSASGTSCSMSPKNTWNGNGGWENNFGWGNSYGTFRFPKTGNPFILMIVGASAVSHAGVGCSAHGCINNPGIYAYTY